MNMINSLSFCLLLLLLFSPHAHAMDLCGDGQCGVSENSYWCSSDCGGVCGDTLCSRDESSPLCSECVCTESAEEELGRLINEYRASFGLNTINIGTQISIVARAHARDSAVSHPSEDGPDCNLHSWSSNTFDNLNFGGCCYRGDQSSFQCMWDKPHELTTLKNYGFEISAKGFASSAAALGGWKASPGHNLVIINAGKWAQIMWDFMGIGIDPQSRYYHVWFYQGLDDTEKTSDCGTTTGLPPPTASPSPSVSSAETASASPSFSSSMSPSVSMTVTLETTSPSASVTTTAPPSVSTMPTIPPTMTPSSSASTTWAPSPSTNKAVLAPKLSHDCKDRFKLSIIEQTKRPQPFLDYDEVLWQGKLNGVDPTAEVDLGVPFKYFDQRDTRAFLKFEVCGTRKIIIRYYEANDLKFSRRSKRKSDRETGLAYDNMQKIVKKVFGRRKRFYRWEESYIRMEVWFDSSDRSATQSITFALFLMF